MAGTARDRMEAGAGAEQTSGGGRRKIHGCNCRDDNGGDGDGDGDIRIRKGNRGGGVTGGQWLQWGGIKRGGRLRPTHFDDRRYTGRLNVAN